MSQLIWNAGQVDAYFFVDSDQWCVPAGRYAEAATKELAERVCALGVKAGWPLSLTMPAVVNVAGVACVPATVAKPQPKPEIGYVRVADLPPEDLGKLSRAGLVVLAAACGLPCLYAADTPKKAIVADILECVARATVPPTVETGAVKNADPATENKG
jgi:hypothetical protein